MEKIQRQIEAENSPIMFLEPSCGHGDIVTAMIEDLERRKTPPSRVSINGYDIDSNAIRSCQKSLQLSSQYQVSWTCQNILDNQSFHEDTPARPLVVCLGGPPFTTGAGSSAEIQRDLTTLFIQHCIKKWSASVVCFLLPSRYRDCTTTLPAEFQCETYSLQSSTFFFLGSLPVTQPSSMQCFSLKYDMPNASRAV
jgi:hypothetical protein